MEHYPNKKTRDDFYTKPLPVCLTWMSGGNANTLKDSLVQFGGSASVVEECTVCGKAKEDKESAVLESFSAEAPESISSAPVAMAVRDLAPESPDRLTTTLKSAPGRKSSATPTAARKKAAASRKKPVAKKAAAKKKPAAKKAAAKKKPAAKKAAARTKPAAKKVAARKTGGKARPGGSAKKGSSQRGGRK